MAKAIKISHYFEDIWQLKEVQPALLEALVSRDCLIEIVNGQPPYLVVIGVPHQAAVGINRISDNWVNDHGKKGRNSDEGAAFHALVALTALRDNGIPCKLVISAHDTQYDPNKDASSPYWNAIFSDEMQLLFECHGASAGRKVDLEISSGQNELGKPLEFGRILARVLEFRYSLISQAKAGSRQGILIKQEEETETEIENPANKTNSLIEAANRRIPALHLEARPLFRIPQDRSNTVTPDGLILGRGIAKSFLEYMANPLASK
jgi:hypothetical protein